jgi:chromosome segregation ATPase
MNPNVRRTSFALLSLSLALLAGCRAASNLLFEPKATDPLDGYKGSLAEAGINTEMDWGPKQNLLLSEFKTLKETHKKLEDRVDQLVEENRTLTTRLANETGTLQKEKLLHAQAEAETEQLRQRRRDLEARILGLSIEKAKLEQANLKYMIDALSATLDQANAAPAEAATPPRGR